MHGELCIVVTVSSVMVVTVEISARGPAQRGVTWGTRACVSGCNQGCYYAPKLADNPTILVFKLFNGLLRIYPSVTL